jgi:hypothetical protein
VTVGGVYVPPGVPEKLLPLTVPPMASKVTVTVLALHTA